jgi:SulP family sulfate permease
MASTGAIARSANNIKCGGKTPVAGMMVGVVLLSILLFAAPFAKYIPLCVLAAIMFVVGYNMGEWSSIPKILRLTKADIAVWLVTFVLTASGAIDNAIRFGFILAAALYIQKVSATTSVGEYKESVSEGVDGKITSKNALKGANIFNIQGPFLFGATHKLSQISDRLEKLPPVIILQLKDMTAIDATGIQALEVLAKRIKESNRHLILCGLTKQPEKLLRRAKFHLLIGEENYCNHLSEALSRAQQITSNDIEYVMAERASHALQYSRN